MSVQPEHCDTTRIERFLDDLLPEDERITLEDHLECCEACRRWITDSAAEPTWWTDANCHLRDEAMDLDPLSREIQTIDEESHEDVLFAATSTRADIEHVREWLSPTDDPRMIGRLAAYEIVGVVGSGGMGIVLKGFDAALNRYVAIKLLAPHLATSAAARQRFAREAQAAAAVVNENVIEIYGVAETKGVPYLVMPYVRGKSLQKRLDESGSLSVTEVLRIGMQAAAGLAAAHAQGLVHRDIKPANILLADGVERVTLTDFGLARAADDASLTHTGIIAGTPQYMSPEQARGDRVDHRSDLFSLGSLLYTMCTGRPPFRADTSYGVLSRIVETAPRPIQELNCEVPTWLCRIVDRLHEKSVTNRYQSASEVAELLEDCLAHVQQPFVSPLPLELRKRAANRFRFSNSYVLGAAILIAGVLLVASAIMNWPRGPRDARDTSANNNQPDPATVHSSEDSTSTWSDGLAETLNGIDEEIGKLDEQVTYWPERLHDNPVVFPDHPPVISPSNNTPFQRQNATLSD